jgi:hypothetical protein
VHLVVLAQEQGGLGEGSSPSTSTSTSILVLSMVFIRMTMIWKMTTAVMAVETSLIQSGVITPVEEVEVVAEVHTEQTPKQLVKAAGSETALRGSG